MVRLGPRAGPIGDFKIFPVPRPVGSGPWILAQNPRVTVIGILFPTENSK